MKERIIKLSTKTYNDMVEKTAKCIAECEEAKAKLADLKDKLTSACKTFDIYYLKLFKYEQWLKADTESAEKFEAWWEEHKNDTV